MKLTTTQSKVERSDDLVDEATFSIALTSKAIEVLSSQIYKDAQLAIIRELGTNAADSHIEAGKKDVPFEVTLPNALVPELVIRDFGVGMSYEKCMNMYRTYFGSDKTSSNEVTGCLGLGSKSPLAYTDQFTVTSWFDGEKSVYTIYKNERGVPCINRIHHEPSTEPQGVEVRISIKRYDFDAFRSKALETYRWFNPRPKIGGVTDKDFANEEILYSGGSWALRKFPPYSSVNMIVVMGNVAYQVTRNDITSFLSRLPVTEKTLAESGPILYMDIGSVDIAASRESLKFDGKKTAASLQKALANMRQEIVDKFQADIAKSKTHWEARKTLRIAKQIPVLKGIIPEKVNWNGIPVSDSIKLKYYDTGSWRGYYYPKTIYADCKKYHLKEKRGYHGAASDKRVSTQNVDTIHCEENAELFIADSKNVVSRLNYYVRSKNGLKEPCVYLLSQAVDEEHVMTDGNKRISKAYDLNAFLKENHLTVRKTSELSDPPRKAATTRTKSSQILKPVPDSNTSSDWRDNTINFDEGGIYVEVYGNKWSSGTLKDRKTSEFFGQLAKIIDPSKIVGVRKPSIPDFEESDNWQRLDEYIEDKFSNDLTSRELYIAAEAYKQLDNEYSIHEFNTFCHFNFNGLDGTFADLCNICNKIYTASKDKSTVQFQVAMPFLATKLDLSKEVQTKVDEVKNLYKKYLKLYPLLEHVKFCGTSNSAVIHYVKLIDDSQKKVNEINCQTHMKVF